MDYYTILGIPRTATAEEIKQAYKKKVKETHPDRGGDEEAFKKITEAYEILSNSDKRSAYDNPNPGFSFNSQDFGRGFNPFGDIFEQFGYRQQQRPKNRDITIAADIDLEDVYAGKDLVVQYRLQSGKVETVTVNVPAGARHGDTIRYQELGNDGHHKFQRGDLFVKVRIRNNNQWLREGNNLITKKSVNVFDLMLGCAIIIKTPDNKNVKLNVPKATKPGTMLSISGYGLPDLHNNRVRGNVIVQINAEVPDINNEQLLEELLNLRNKIYTKE